MKCDTDESHFLNLESEDLPVDRLESLADSYFSTQKMKRKLLTPTPTAVQTTKMTRITSTSEKTKMWNLWKFI